MTFQPFFTFVKRMFSLFGIWTFWANPISVAIAILAIFNCMFDPDPPTFRTIRGSIYQLILWLTYWVIFNLIQDKPLLYNDLYFILFLQVIALFGTFIWYWTVFHQDSDKLNILELLDEELEKF